MFRSCITRFLPTVCLVLILTINTSYSQPSPGYYSSVDESTPSALKASLHTIIKDHTKIPYTSGSTDTWDVLELAGEDVDDSNKVIALYKNADYTKVHGGNNDYNREHSWPKSYGFPNDNSGNYPYTDMHHLFIANGSYNSSRSNKPFDICVSGCTERATDVNNGRGGAGHSNQTKTGIWDVWDGRQGDVARAMFYMAVRYEGGNHGITNRSEPDLELTDNLTLIENSQTGSNESQAYMGLLSVLIQWHNSDPVDIYEHQHNEAVEDGQGNRNPFIDHPEWVACVFELNCSGGGDTTAPNAPNNLTASAPSVGTISLDWFNNTEADLAGYNVFRSTTSGSGFTKLNASLITVSNYNDSSVANSTTYYYRTTAVDNAGNESSNSSQVTQTSQAPSSGGNVLQNGVAETGLSDPKDGQKSYTMEVPSGASNLAFTLTNISGDADLYVKFGSAPTTGNYDCRSYRGSNADEDCNIASVQTGTYYILIDAYSAYSGARLLGSYSTSASNVAPNAVFSSSCTDLTCSFDASSSSDSDGSISNYSWSFGGSGSNQSHTFASAGTYSVVLTVTDNDGATDTATQNVSVTAPPANSNELVNGVAKTNLSAAKDEVIHFTMEVPAGASNLVFAMSGGSSGQDADLYVKFGSIAALNNHDCRPYIGGSNETCTISNVQAGTYSVMVNAFSTFSNVNLTGSYTTGGGSQQSVFASSSNVNIPDNSSTGATSNISVNRTGNAGNLTITYDIVHTYRGDLTVKLVDPNGVESTLRSPSGGSTHNINESKNINKGSTSANGTWGLKVIDGANADTGYINSWSIEFL